MSVRLQFYTLLLLLLGFKELELYKEELLSKPALLVVNKMDLPDAEDKLAELKEQLEKPHGKVASLCLFKLLLVLYFLLWDSYGKQNGFFFIFLP